MRARLVVSLLTGLAATGCASSVYEGKYAWDDGWREAKVVRAGPASELGTRHSSDCSYKPAQVRFSASDRFVVVSFASMSRQQRAVLPLAADSADPAPGMLVYANVRNCDRARLEPRAKAGAG